MNGKVVVLFLLLTNTVLAQSNARISGHITDRDSGEPYNNVLVEIFSVSDHTKPVDSATTDDKGQYTLEVPHGNYDIYVRLGRRNPTQQIFVQEGQLQIVDFLVSIRAIEEESLTESPGFMIVVILAISIFLIILIDQIYFRRKRLVKELENEQKELKERLEKRGEGEESELELLEKEKDRIEYMVNLTKTKYHRRKIGAENFRELMRDYQKKLIEVEAKIVELKGG